MENEAIFVVSLFCLMIISIFSGKLRYDIAALLTLLIFYFTGFISGERVFAGFASNAVFMLLATFFISEAFYRTGLSDYIGNKIYAIARNDIRLNIAALTTIAAIISMFINNVAVTAILIPTALSLARRIKLPPSKLLMPLAFGACLGGMGTLIGYTPHLITDQMLRDAGIAGISLFSFMPYALGGIFIGLVFLSTVAYRLLPDNSLHRTENTLISEVYDIPNRIFAIKFPVEFNFKGKSLGDLRFGSLFGVGVMAIMREGKIILTPGSDERIQGNDILIVRGNRKEFEVLLEVANSAVTQITKGEAEIINRFVRIYEIEFSEESNLIGLTVTEFVKDAAFALIPIVLRRRERNITQNLQGRTITEGDRLLVISADALLDEKDGITTKEVSVETLKDNLFIVPVCKGSALIGKRYDEYRLDQFMGVSLFGVVKRGELIFSISNDYIFEEGDRIIIVSDHNRINMFLGMKGVQLLSKTPFDIINEVNVGLGEAMISPRSSVVGRTLGEMDFVDKYGLQVLALWRDGKVIRKKLAEIPLRFGDALLLFGNKKYFNKMASDRNFVLLSEAGKKVVRKEKMPYALASLLLIVVLNSFHIASVGIAGMSAILWLILTKTLSMEEGYACVQWKVIFFIASLIPMGDALTDSGASVYLAQLLNQISFQSETTIIATLFIVTALLCQLIDAVLIVTFMLPIAISIAKLASLDPVQLAIAVGLGSNITYLSPYSTGSNLIVMGPGGYRVRDYVKTGGALAALVVPVTLLSLILL